MSYRYPKCHHAAVTVIQEVREEVGVSQRALSEVLGRPRNFMSVMEGGGRALTLCEFIRIIHALGADPVKVMSRIVKKMGRPEL